MMPTEGVIKDRAPATASSTDFHVVTVGWGPRLVEGMLDRIQARTDIRFSHIVIAPADLAGFNTRPSGSPVIPIRPSAHTEMPEVDVELLASLETDGVPTIHNMVLADRVLRALPYEDALRYATYLARRLIELFEQLQPSVVIGGFDALHAGMGLAVARRMNIPWFAMYFTTLPQRYASFCSGMTPDTVVAVQPRPDDELRSIAERTIDEYRAAKLVVLAYVSANNMMMVVKRLPTHLRVLLPVARRTMSRQFDRYTEYPVRRLAREWVRKRRNLLRLPKDWFVKEPPTPPYLFFGLQMQPESSLDTWAPFFTNQVNVVELIARAMPPSHRLLVKLHKSDADNYSRAQLARLRALPGVELVWPAAQSRTFVENAALVVAIQGTMAIEAVLLGKPVLMFGQSPVQDLPGVAGVGALPDLPRQIRELLTQEPPTREELVQGYMKYLSLYGPGCYYDWETTLPENEVDNLAEQFRALRRYAEGRRAMAAR